MFAYNYVMTGISLISYGAIIKQAKSSMTLQK